MEKELVEFMVRSLVDQPDEVSVNVIEGRNPQSLSFTLLKVMSVR